MKREIKKILLCVLISSVFILFGAKITYGVLTVTEFMVDKIGAPITMLVVLIVLSIVCRVCMYIVDRKVD